MQNKRAKNMRYQLRISYLAGILLQGSVLYQVHFFSTKEVIYVLTFV